MAVTAPTRLEHDWWPRPLPSNVELGPRSWLYSGYALQRCHSRQPCAVRIGHDTGVYEFTRFDLGPQGQVEIGAYGTIVSPVFSTNARVVIGDYAFVSNDVFLADSPFAVPPCERRESGEPGGAAADIVMGDDVWIATKVVVLGGVRLGDGAIVGAGAVVDRDVPDYAVVAGNPARVVASAPPGGRR